MKKRNLNFFCILAFSLVFLGCVKRIPEMTLEEIETARNAVNLSLIEKTKSKPYTGQKYETGTVGGVWNTSITDDPKSFNQLIAERDGSTAAIVSMMTCALTDYDFTQKKWIALAAFFEIKTDEEAGTLDVIFTLRDNLYWTFPNSDKKIPVTSDDVIFWYNKIEGNPAFASSLYNSQFLTMNDGSVKHIDIERIDDKSFVFHFPRIVAEPLLSTNCDLKPSFLYKKALETGGEQAVKNLLSVNTPVSEIPSCGFWYLTEYTPGQRLVYERNPNYWKKDENNISIPYRQQCIVQIVSDMNTQELLFKQGKQESYSVRPENLDRIIANQKNDYTVYNSEGSLGAGFLSFNQNPINQKEPFYKWFTKKEFRQAMSCILNRERIISQTYRSMAVPKYSFFPKGNPFYNENIELKYRYNPTQALDLLQKVGFEQKVDGFLYDSDGNQVVFDLTIPSGAASNSDIAQIITAECKKIGITVNVRQVDFQKLIEQLTSTYDWQSTILALGVNIWPSQGSNVWPSDGNLHLWYPLQEKPATEWEARLDYLYNEGKFTIDYEKAKIIWDEFQSIILEECPVIYLVCGRSFYAIRNTWNQTNFYFDNINGAITDYLWIAE